MARSPSVVPQAQDVPSVSQLTEHIRSLLGEAFPSVWVRGEISDFLRASSGHLYFNLKDDAAKLGCVVWRSAATRMRTPLEDGQEVICRGAIDVYPPRGNYQLIVSQIAPVGMGALQLAFQELHAKLKARGWFDSKRKRSLPRMPESIGLVTSPEGAAVRDFLEVLGRRWPSAEVLLVPTRVQGTGAAEEIARAIRLVNRVRPAPKVLALCRGGGSAEDLWSFNEEIVCQAIFESQIPVVSGIGHEIDVTLSDLVADVRALTPTEAAERIAPDRQELLESLQLAWGRVNSLVRERIARNRLLLDALSGRAVLARPLASIREWSLKVDELSLRCRHGIQKRLEQFLGDCQVVAGRLESLNPLGVLARGFSLTSSADRPVVNDAEQVQVDDEITTRLAKGQLVSRVTAVHRAPPN